MGNDRIEVGFGLEAGFDGPNESFEAAKAVESVFVAELG